MSAQNKLEKKIVAQNRKARYNYNIVETLEAGIVLVGSEVKMLRKGQGNIAEGYITVNKKTGYVELVNISIPTLVTAKYFGHDERRVRTLLLHKKEIKKISDYIFKQGRACVPLELYFNEKGLIKIKIGIAEGKKNVDKRQTIKNREWNLDKARILKNNQK